MKILVKTGQDLAFLQRNFRHKNAFGPLPPSFFKLGKRAAALRKAKDLSFHLPYWNRKLDEK